MGRKRKLSKEQVLDGINQWIVEHGNPPTVKELQKSLKLGSVRTAFRYLKWLEDEDLIERWPGARGLKTLKTSGTGLQTREVPLVGVAPAGPFMTAKENREGAVRLPTDFFKPQNAKFFLLRVKGDSMNRCKIQGETIEDGDLVLVRQQAVARPGDVVVALVDGEATIKRFSHGQGYYVLKPESTNSAYVPIVLKSDFRVQGIIVRILKKGAQSLHISASKKSEEV